MKDLYFENEGCATLIPTNGHLNFEKFNRLGQRLSEFALWKNVECPYEKTPAIADYLQCYPILSEEGKQPTCYTVTHILVALTKLVMLKIDFLL